MAPELRREEILEDIKKRDISCIGDLTAELNIPLSIVRKDVVALEQEDSVIVMCGGAVKYRAGDFDEPVIRKKLIHSEEKEIIARKAAVLVEDGDCIYVDSSTTTAGMLEYLQGKQITTVPSSTELLDNLPIKNAKCILLGGEVRDDLGSALGALTEKMIPNVYFDKAFIGANGYIPDGGIYTYDGRKARKEVTIKDRSKAVYVLMDISKKDKYTFSKVFDLGEAVLIIEEEDSGDP